jgi:Ca-activated chloride channel homolog
MRNNKNIILTQSRQDAKKNRPLLLQFFAPLHLCVSMFFVSSFLFSAHAESVRSENNRGVQEYKSGDFSKAAESFEQAAKETTDNQIPAYNAGAAHAAQGNWDKALPFWQQSAGTKNAELARQSKQAQGLAAYKKAGQLQQEKKLDDAKKSATASEELNKQVLREDGTNNDARINLELATNLRKAIEKELQQQQNQQQDQKKDDKKQDQDKQDKDKQDQTQQNKDKQDQQKQDQNKQDQDKQDQQQDQTQQKQDDSQKQEQDKQKNDQQQKEQDKQKQDQQQQEQDKQKDQQDQQQQDKQQAESAEEDKQDKDKPKDQDASLSVLNLLDSNKDAEPLKQMMKQRYGKVRHPEKDW